MFFLNSKGRGDSPVPVRRSHAPSQAERPALHARRRATRPLGRPRRRRAWSACRRTTRGLKTVYNDRVVPLQQLKTISDDYAVFIIDAVNKSNAG